MHTDLSPHLHTPECNKFISELKECHNNHGFLKFLGACNNIDARVVKCLKKERIRRQRANAAEADRRRSVFKSKMAAAETETN